MLPDASCALPAGSLRDRTQGTRGCILTGMTSTVPEFPVSDVGSLRRGRHRNHALAQWRRGQAMQLLPQGRTYQQVADQLG